MPAYYLDPVHRSQLLKRPHDFIGWPCLSTDDHDWASQKRAKPGRKRINHVDPENPRLAQNRESQRAYRQRQIDYTRQLEAKAVELMAILESKETEHTYVLETLVPEIKQLTAENAQLQQVIDLYMFQSQQQVCLMCMNRATSSPTLLLPLEPALNQTPSWNQLLSPNGLMPSPSSPTSSPMPGLTTSSGALSLGSISAMASSKELFGPLKTEKLITDLQSVDEFAVSEFLRTYEDMTNQTTTATIKQSLLNFITARRAMLNACTLLDRQRVIGVLEEAKQFNMPHHDFAVNCFVSTSEANQRIVPSAYRVESIALSVSELLNKIEALSGAKELIEEMADICADSKMHDYESNCFVRFLQVRNQLQSLCKTTEDRHQLMLAMEVGRASNRQHFEGVEK
ncbi:hypothetical protein HDU98_008784 [Podochytrium sp. JEL0797]|nr:hypothetical protein HDU98_008784 [Podochytrium sp. JEL0797]